MKHKFQQSKRRRNAIKKSKTQKHFKINQNNNSNVFDDNYLADNIIEARTDYKKAYSVYRNYVGNSESDEERLRRINNFRCGGY